MFCAAPNTLRALGAPDVLTDRNFRLEMALPIRLGSIRWPFTASAQSAVARKGLKEMHKSVIGKWFLTTVGFLSVGLAVLGIFLPLLPTTPLLLLAAACFMRTSPRFYTWLINHKLFGSYIRNYFEHKAVSLPAKRVMLGLLWGMMGVTMLFFVTGVWMRMLLGVIAIAVSLHLLQLKTLTPEMILSTEQVFED